MKKMKKKIWPPSSRTIIKVIRTNAKLYKLCIGLKIIEERQVHFLNLKHKNSAQLSTLVCMGLGDGSANISDNQVEHIAECPKCQRIIGRVTALDESAQKKLSVVIQELQRIFKEE